MARDHARILTRIWVDQEFCALTSNAQRLYFMLLSSHTMNHAGVQPLQVSKWQRRCADTDAESIQGALRELRSARFVVVDDESEEVLVRSLMRNDGVVKQPNVLLAAARAALQVESGSIRQALAAEFRRIPAERLTQNHVASAVSDAIGVLEESGGATTEPNPSGNPSPNPSGNPSPNPSKVGSQPLRSGVPSDPSPPPEVALDTPHSKGSGNPSPNPSGNPSPNPRGRGRGKGCSSPSVVGCVSRAHTREATETEPDSPLPDAEPTTTRQRADALNATAISTPAFRLISRWKNTHSGGYHGGTYNSLAREVDALLARNAAPAHIWAALQTWDQRADARPGLLRFLHDDAANRGRSSIDPWTTPVELLHDDDIDLYEILGPDNHPVLGPREIEDGDPEIRRQWYVEHTAQRHTERLHEARQVITRRQELRRNNARDSA